MGSLHHARRPVQSGAALVSAVIEISGTRYAAEPLDPGPCGTAAWRLSKLGGKGEVYDVVRDRHGLVECDCPAYVWTHKGNDRSPCKHGRALVELGLLPAPAPAPARAEPTAADWREYGDWSDGLDRPAARPPVPGVTRVRDEFDGPAAPGPHGLSRAEMARIDRVRSRALREASAALDAVEAEEAAAHAAVRELAAIEAERAARAARFSGPAAPGGGSSHRGGGTMATKQVEDLKRAAIALGATVDDQGERFGWINLDAPVGKVWAANGCHALLVDWGGPGFEGGTAKDRRDMITNAVMDAVDRMAYGMTECDDAECDICHPVD